MRAVEVSVLTGVELPVGRDITNSGKHSVETNTACVIHGQWCAEQEKVITYVMDISS